MSIFGELKTKSLESSRKNNTSLTAGEGGDGFQGQQISHQKLEMMETRRHNTFQEMKENSFQLRIPHSAKTSFSNGEIKILPDEGRIRNFITSRPTLKKWLNEIL